MSFDLHDDDLDLVGRVPFKDADTGTPDDDPAEPYDPHLEGLCCSIERMLEREFGP